MVPPNFYTYCLFALGLASIVTSNPIAQGAPRDRSYNVGPRTTFLKDIPEVIYLTDRRSAQPDPASHWELKLPYLFSRAVNSTSANNSSSNFTLNSDETAGLNMHNTARATKGIPPLKWDPSLQAQALAYAKKLMWGTSLVHSKPETRPNQGENLAFIGTALIFFNTEKNPITVATKGWLDEAPLYKGEPLPQGNFSAYGHYTQCMWNTTQNVGIAAVSGVLGGWWVVARYSPGGNIYGQTPY